MPLTPPTSRSFAVYEAWRNSAPTDEELLTAAHEYLDLMEPQYERYRRENPHHYPTGPTETPEEYRERVHRLVGAWKDLGWTRGDLHNFEVMPTAEKRDAYRRMATGRLRRGDTAPLRDFERAGFYH